MDRQRLSELKYVSHNHVETSTWKGVNSGAYFFSFDVWDIEMRAGVLHAVGGRQVPFICPTVILRLEIRPIHMHLRRYCITASGSMCTLLNRDLNSRMI